MKKIIFIITLLIYAMSFAAYAGNCDYSWQTAKDGSRCGGRAADQRPGGGP